ncbi:hypothetical protein Hanom_Chr11g01009261 [Helianthus anomalus]
MLKCNCTALTAAGSFCARGRARHPATRAGLQPHARCGHLAHCHARCGHLAHCHARCAVLTQVHARCVHLAQCHARCGHMAHCHAPMRGASTWLKSMRACATSPVSLYERATQSRPIGLLGCAAHDTAGPTHHPRNRSSRMRMTATSCAASPTTWSLQPLCSTTRARSKIQRRLSSGSRRCHARARACASASYPSRVH